MGVLQGRIMKSFTAVAHLSDEDLLVEVKVAAVLEREATARMIALLSQLDARRLFLGEGCSSLFAYCTQVLHLSEHAAYGRIEAARAARKFPIVLDLLSEGLLTLTAVTLLAPHLTPVNHLEVLKDARHKSKREVEQLVARLRPQPPVPATVRKLPEQRARENPVMRCEVERSAQRDVAAVLSPPPAARPAVVVPLAPERYKVQFTVSRDTHDKLRRAQDLLRHSIPDGDPAAIFDRALTLLLSDLERTRLAATERPRTSRATRAGSRHIPAAVRREVWKRDGGQCAFVGTHGRCSERGFLEFHHLEPYAVGGLAVAENVALRCRAHNAFEAEQYFSERLPVLLREAPALRYGGSEVGPDRVARLAAPIDSNATGEEGASRQNQRASAWVGAI
jgi:5-methylcytosine-specific restriction endonuclease McrA